MADSHKSKSIGPISLHGDYHLTILHFQDAYEARKAAMGLGWSMKRPTSRADQTIDTRVG